MDVYTVTWIVNGMLFSIATPNPDTADQVAARMPMARLWWTGKAGRPHLVCAGRW